MADRRFRTHVEATVIDDDATFTIREVCAACGVHAERIVEIVEYGIVEPPNAPLSRWRFSAAAVYRIRRALNLCRDLDLNLAGASLAIDLLDELEGLRSEVERLSRLNAPRG